MTKDKILEKLKQQSDNALFLKDCGDENVKELFDKHFGLVCKKCGSTDIFVNWENGNVSGGYTEYDEGEKLFKCNSCGNAMSFYS